MIHKHLVFNRRRSITMMLALAILCAVTAAAAPANSVIINGVSIFSQRYLLNDGVTLSTTGTLGADAMAHFDPNTGILTLHGYNGGRIIAGHGDLTIKLVGTNRVTVIENHSGMAIGIVGSSTTDNLLTITADSNAALVVDVQNEGTGSAHCIAHNTSVPMSLRISGLANVTTIATASAAEGIGAWGLFEILDQATLNVELHGGNLYGSWGIINWGPNGDPTLTVFNTAGKVLVDVSEATNDRAVCLISDSYQLLRVGNMTLKWHENGGEMALPQNFKYEKADFAVCKDQTKAVYRYGTPRDLRVTGGDIDGNVSVGIFNRNVQFLAGDVAGISANVPENYNFTNWTTTGG
ncbi:MAG: hypothetical protein FWG54_01680, partial [Bacteroidetes bacterium]|nr:hypothetical protein [Bacteroidota bacterium]